MKNTFLSLIALFILSGCEDIYVDDENSTTQSESLVDASGYLPEVKEGEGEKVKLADYLYPDGLTEDKIYTFDKVYKYAQDKNLEYNDVSILQRGFTKTINDSSTIITKYQGVKELYIDYIYPHKITTNRYKNPTDLKANIAKNNSITISINDFLDGDSTKRCVVKNIAAQDLALKLPLHVKTNLLSSNYLKEENGAFALSQFNFESVMYIHCGTTDDKTSESYYSKKYGLILKIEKDMITQMKKIEVADVLSVKNE